MDQKSKFLLFWGLLGFHTELGYGSYTFSLNFSLKYLTAF